MDSITLRISGRTIIKIGGISGILRMTILIQLYKLQLFGNDPSGTILQKRSILYGIFNIE